MLVLYANPVAARARDRARCVHLGVKRLCKPLVRARPLQDGGDGRDTVGFIDILDDDHACQLPPHRLQHMLGVNGPRRRERCIAAVPAARELVTLGRDDEQVDDALGERFRTARIHVDALAI